MIKLINKLHDWLDLTRHLDFIAPLALRLYLVPVFWVAGNNKLAGFDDVVAWFGNTEWGLGLPAPQLMATLAMSTEIGGAVLLLLGLATRWITIPMMFTMVVAMVTVHWQNGWQAIADKMSPFPPPDIDETMNRLQAARELLQQYGNYDWLTAGGNFVISNNGVEFAVTYLIMLLALFFYGGGKYVSLDYWIARKFRNKNKV